MNTTENFELLKPTGSENYSVNVQNTNMDLIDSELKRIEEQQNTVLLRKTDVVAIKNSEIEEIISMIDHIDEEDSSMIDRIDKEGLIYLWGRLNEIFQEKGDYLEEETDPTVPAWAKEENKPNYAAAEVGADTEGSAAKALTDAKEYTNTVMQKKVDIQTGKQLSTNDYTNTDKEKLAGIEQEANKTILDAVLSLTSTNSVQNKVIAQEITDINTLISQLNTLKVSTEQFTAALNAAKDYADDTYRQAAGYTDIKIADLIGGAQSTIETLNALSDAIATNESVMDALNKAIGTKAAQAELDGHTGNDTIHVTKTKTEKWDAKQDALTIDAALSLTSTNPVQNKVIKAALDEVFQSVSNGKTQLAAAITDKGYAIAATAEFAAMVANIAKIGSEADVTAAQILSGKKAYVGSVYIIGTMTDRGAVVITLNAGDTYTILSGYHNGSGKITVNSLASQTSATATAAQILSTMTAWVNGVKITGTMESKAAATYTPGTANQTIAAGQYLSGAQTISGDANLIAANILTGKTIFGVNGTFTSDGTATASQMLSGVIAYVKGSKITGTISSKVAATFTPGTADQTIAAGQYLSGIQTVLGDANLIAANIVTGKSIFGVSGTFSSDATATAAQILSGCIAYVKGAKVTGTMTSKAASTYTPTGADQTIAAGQYLSGAQTISGSANLVAANIKSGVAIFGVTGTFTSDGTATAAQILSGIIAYVNGAKITGTMTNNGAVTSAINAEGSYTIPAGYHNGSGKVTGNTLASQTAGTATAEQVLSGQTAWVGGTKLTGTMVNNGPTYSSQKRLSAHESYIVPEGYHSGNLEISCNAYSLYRFSAPVRTSAYVLTVDLSKISNYQTFHVNCMFVDRDYSISQTGLSSSVFHKLSKSYDTSTGLLTLKYSGSSGSPWSGTASNNAFTLLIINDPDGVTRAPIEMNV